MENVYDAIVIGARCAGSPTAMLLSQKGYKVLLLDKAEFPSDTISTHIIWPPGTEQLKRWGLLDPILNTKCPIIKKVIFDFGAYTLTGTPPPSNGVFEIIAPRRTVLDKILVDAAVHSGAELRQNCFVEDITIEENEAAVTTVRARVKGGFSFTEKGRIVIGADGRNSIVARKMRAEETISIPSLTYWSYTYWSDLPVEDLVIYTRPNRGLATIPTHDGLIGLPIAFPAEDFRHLRSNIEEHYMKTLELTSGLAECVRQGRRVDRFYGAAIPNFFRKSFGPGWVLVGDASYSKDPITAQGISDAFFESETLAEALDAVFSGRESFDEALNHHQQVRDERVMPMFEYTCDWAKLQPPTPDQEILFSALRQNQTETDRFSGTLAGTVSIPEFFSTENIQKIVGALS